MSTLHFFRHGQAGLRDDYDNLSQLGHTQARLLGEFLAGQKLVFSKCLVGGLIRQQKTAAEVQSAYLAAKLDFPAPLIDPNWNEFDLDGVCAGLAPLIANDDPDFAGEWEALMLATRDAASHLHRAWLPCDAEIVRAWIDDRYEFAGESWPAFQSRIRTAFDQLLNRHSDTGENIAIFTSGTPIALIVAATLQFDARRALRLAGTSCNSAFTSIAVKAHEPYLVTFNATPHLPDAAMRTSR